MSDITPNLQLPYIIPDQAQKHVTHNEALQRLDGLAQIILLDVLPAPPTSAESGLAYGVAASASGLWFGHDGEIALLQDGYWLFTKPRRGWLAWLESRSATVCFDGTAWSDLKPPPGAQALTGPVDMLGINAAADAANRLTVSSAGSLFNNAGAGHQLKINKAGNADTASLLFQTGFSGRAEIGLAGNNSLSFKVSANGSAWTSALTIDGSGVVALPNRPACRASLNGGALQPVPAATYIGFQTFPFLQGAVGLGADVPSANMGKAIQIKVAGTYLIQVTLVLPVVYTTVINLLLNSDRTLLTMNGVYVSTGSTLNGVVLANLAAGDQLMLQHVSGNAKYDFSVGKTEIFLCML